MNKEQAHQLWIEALSLADKLSKRSYDKRIKPDKQKRYLSVFQRAHARKLRRWNLYQEIRGTKENSPE